MPWREATKMSQRIELVEKWDSGLYSVAELAEEFGITRPTVYLWIRRSQAKEGLADRPSIPKSCPHRTSEEIADRIVAAKRENPHWGPEILIKILRRDEPSVRWPSASTAGRILDEQGLVKRRRKRRLIDTIRQVRGPLQASVSGEMMTGDHKGEFLLGNGQYCYPVTINEPVSRYIYAITAADSTSVHRAKPVFERVFQEHGIPWVIGTDNGGPFCCSRSLGGLTPLSVWWIKLGITPVRIHKSSPWENGIHERMHKTLKAETTRPASQTMRLQQKRFDQFRSKFNGVRPHQGLGGDLAPSSALKPCARPYPTRVPAVDYPGHYEVRRVQRNGQIKWKGESLFVTESLAGEPIGLEETDDGIWTIRFAKVELGRFNERTKSIS